MISVIIPTFNRAGLLEKAIESVLSQTYRDFELIVIDDGSDDETCGVIEDFRDPIKYIRQKRGGPASARNTGIRESRGEFIAFLDSDDRWDRDKLSIQTLAMDRNAGYLVAHTGELWYRNGKLLNQKQRHLKSGGYIFDRCLELCAVSMSTAMVRKELFDAVELFDENLPCCEDYDFWLRVSAGHDFLFIDRPLTFKDGGRPDQVSSIYATGIDRFRIQSILKLLDSGLLDEGQRRLAVGELRRKCGIYGRGCLKHGRPEEAEYYLSLRG